MSEIARGSETQSSLTLWNVRVLDGRGSPTRERRFVTIVGGLIERVGAIEGEIRPPDAIDADGRTALPGMIDAHFHIENFTLYGLGDALRTPLEGEEPRAPELRHFANAKSARLLLDAGVTTLRDVGSYEDDGLILRQAIAEGFLDGPRILSCGRIISATSPGGRLFSTMYREADGADDMRRAAREQLRRGADYIKLMATGARSVVRENPEPAQMTQAELGAVVDEAHRMRVRVAAHAEGLEGARLAIEEGVDTIEHGLSLHRAPNLLSRMAERGIVLVPTLSTFHDISERFADRYSPKLVNQAKQQLDEAYMTVTAAQEAGVTLAMGYDSGPPGTNAVELMRLVHAGLSATEAIVAGTRGSATALGIEGEVGTVETGKIADFVLVDGDPTLDVGLLSEPAKIWLVIQAGRMVGGQAMTPHLRAAKARDQSQEQATSSKEADELARS